MPRQSYSLLGLLALGLLASTVRAEPENSADSFGVQLEQLQKQLDADSFAERREASQQLRRLGARAIPTLRESAERGTAESRARALEVLGQHFEQGSEDLHAAAEAALKELAQGDGPAARSAQAILHPVEAAAPDGLAMNPVLRKQILRQQIMQQQIMRQQIIQQQQQMQQLRRMRPDAFLPGAPGGRGHIRIAAQRGPQRITIASDARGINVEIRETKDGKETVEKFHVKDANELKQRHAEAHALLEQVKAPQLIPGMPARGLNAAQAAQIAQRIEQLRLALPNAPAEARPAMERHIESLEQMRKQRLQPADAPQP